MKNKKEVRTRVIWVGKVWRSFPPLAIEGFSSERFLPRAFFKNVSKSFKCVNEQNRGGGR
jgi:hypothetical protein